MGQIVEAGDAPVADLTPLLDDARPRVRDRVIAQLAKRGAMAVKPLEAVLRDAKRSAQARRNAVWALCRQERAKRGPPCGRP